MSRPQPRLTGAVALSAVVHASAAALFLILAGRTSVIEDQQPRETDSATMIWIPRAGPEGGRAPGGEGRRLRRVLRAGLGHVSVPSADAPPVEAAPLAPEPPRMDPIVIAAVPSASALQDLPGAPVAVSLNDASGVGLTPGPGGDGRGQDGLGLGMGLRNGLGSGDRGHGSGIVPPQLTTQVRPRYTVDAMRARIQGVVTLDAVVLPDGTVGDVRIVRSLDSTFGLDQEAIKAVKQWRFVPGTRSGRPVPIIITAELTFTLR